MTDLSLAIEGDFGARQDGFGRAISVLVIGSEDDNARLMVSAFAGSEFKNYQVERVGLLADALARLARHDVDLILLDMLLPDGQGLDIIDRVAKTAPGATIIALSENDDEALARKVRRRGAYDCISRDRIDAYWLSRALRYIMERHVKDSVVQSLGEALFQQCERSRVTLNSVGDAVIAIDSSGTVVDINHVAETLTGWPSNGATGKPVSEVFNVIDRETRKAIDSPAQTALRNDGRMNLSTDHILIRRDGVETTIEDCATPVRDRDGKVVGAVIIFRNITESRRMARKMAHLAQHDFLTGLPNRAFLTERLYQAIALARRHDRKVGLLFVDLDNFKSINDSMGHVIGDQALISVAQRLRSCVRETDTVCRQGGDEFVILLSEIEQPQDAHHIADKLIEAFSDPHVVSGNDLYITLSIGVSIFPDNGAEADTLMKNADTAMYHAKSSGRNNHQFFRDEMELVAMHQSVMQSRLRRAIRNQEFVLHYQPQVDMATGEITGVEALIRWQDPEFGLVYPAQFIPIAEQCGLVVPIGRWVLSEACRQVQEWLDAGLCAVPVSVNVSSTELKHKNFLGGVALTLEATRLAPGYLELELTESLLMDDMNSSLLVLTALKDLGIRIALDDFGTGYSSLSHLKRFPINTIKIDQSFVRDVILDQDDAVIVNAVIEMGRNLRQRVIAEGVETREQLAFLQENHCGTGQGYFLGGPLAPEEFALLLSCDDDSGGRRASMH